MDKYKLIFKMIYRRNIIKIKLNLNYCQIMMILKIIININIL